MPSSTVSANASGTMVLCPGTSGIGTAKGTRENGIASGTTGTGTVSGTTETHTHTENKSYQNQGTQPILRL